jgi:hypothetical protein
MIFMLFSLPVSIPLSIISMGSITFQIQHFYVKGDNMFLQLAIAGTPVLGATIVDDQLNLQWLDKE